MRITGRDPKLVDLVERYTKAQGLFRTDDAPEPQFDDPLELDLSTVESSLAGHVVHRIACRCTAWERHSVRLMLIVSSQCYENNVTENALIRLGTEGGNSRPRPDGHVRT